MSKPAYHSKQDVFNFYESDLLDQSRRLVYPHDNATEEVTSAFKRLRKEDGQFIALVDGAFDVPHANHEWYLRHCRSLAAAAFLDQYAQPQNPDAIKLVMGSSAIKLAVTVDADYKINYKKGGKAEKGGVQRPIYPWEARAARVGGYMFKTSDSYRPVVDLVTVEGDDIHEGTALESSLILAQHLSSLDLLDALIVYGEHGATIDEAHQRGLDPIVIPDETNYAFNPQTDAPWSSSDLVRRAQGATVPYPITRPGTLNGAPPSVVRQKINNDLTAIPGGLAPRQS